MIEERREFDLELRFKSNVFEVIGVGMKFECRLMNCVLVSKFFPGGTKHGWSVRIYAVMGISTGSDRQKLPHTPPQYERGRLCRLWPRKIQVEKNYTSLCWQLLFWFITPPTTLDRPALHQPPLLSPSLVLFVLELVGIEVCGTTRHLHRAHCPAIPSLGPLRRD